MAVESGADAVSGAFTLGRLEPVFSWYFTPLDYCFCHRHFVVMKSQRVLGNLRVFASIQKTRLEDDFMPRKSRRGGSPGKLVCVIPVTF